MFPLISFAFIVARSVSAIWTETDFQTVLHCTTRYVPISNSSNVNTDWLSTDTYTTTEWPYFTKTELYTPRASTTTVSATSTVLEYLTRDNWTTIITTATSTTSTTLTTIEIVNATTTKTVLETAYVTIFPADYVPPSPSVRVKNKNDWDVADIYWTAEPSGTEGRDVPVEPAGAPVKVDCTLITQSNNFWTTVTIKQPGPTLTYTRTTVLATETSTSTVRTRHSGRRPASVETWEWSYCKWITTYETFTTTSTATVRSFRLQ